MLRDISFITVIFVVLGGWLYLAFSHPTYTRTMLLIEFWPWYALGIVAIWAAYWSAYGRRE